MNEKNPYRPIKSEVLKVIPETPTIRTIRFKPEESIPFKTGQFVEITIPGVGEAPFTPSSSPSEEEIMEVTVMKVGKVTEEIHRLQEGDIIGVRGPYGEGYPLQKFQNKEILVVGGGCGFAPLRSLMYELFERSEEFKSLFYRGGCKVPKEILYRDEMKKWSRRDDLNLQLTVDEADEDWEGPVGVVTSILDNVEMDYEKGIAVVCGPPVAMKFGTQKLLEMGFKEHNIYLSMEKNMSCGIGKCGHCRIGTYYACKDGPVFTYDKIKNAPNIWE